MTSVKHDPFLWIHLAGIAIAPLALQIVWIAIGSGTPISFYWLEFLLVAAVGIIPIFIMQWNRPFSIYSFLVIALKPSELSSSQQKVLTLFKRKINQIFTVIIAILMLLVLWLIYKWAPVAGLVTPFVLPSRLLAVIIAAIAFLISNLFIQIPISVLLVLLTPQKQWENTQPISTETIPTQFTIFGWRVNKILPPVEAEAN